jgi:hypothetical protein
MLEGAGQWPDLILIIARCPETPLHAACCDPADADDVWVLECQPPVEWTHDTACADLEPACGNPGACCEDIVGESECLQTVHAQCAERFMPAANCADDHFTPPCGEYQSCRHTLVLWADAGNGWPDASVDIDN